MPLTISLAVLLVVIAAAFALPKIAKARAMDRQESHVQGEIRLRLGSIATEVGGTIVDGPALQTAAGRMTLVASRAPKEDAIDVAKFSTPLAVKQQLTLIPTPDAAKALVTKNLHPVTPEDPKVAADYKLLASEDSFGKKVVTPALVDRLRELDVAVKARSRLQIAPSGATVLVARELAKPEELRAFYDKSVAVMKCLQTLAET